MDLKLTSPDTWDYNSSFLGHYHSVINERDFIYFLTAVGDSLIFIFYMFAHLYSRGHVCVEVREQRVGVGCLLSPHEF